MLPEALELVAGEMFPASQGPEAVKEHFWNLPEEQGKAVGGLGMRLVAVCSGSARSAIMSKRLNPDFCGLQLEPVVLLVG